MALKRKICEDYEKEVEVETKTARLTEDRLSTLPVDLKLHILSFLDSKDAVKTSMLSKTWISLWSRIPVLEFHSFSIFNIYTFDKFVNAVLRRDRSAKLDRLTFYRRGVCSAKMLKNVFEYAFSHGVKTLEARIDKSKYQTWPVSTGFESNLTSLKLETGYINMNCPFLEPRSSGSFKNLTVLYLRRAIITDLDPFSGFPVLEKLTLFNCDISTEGKALNVNALNLLEVTICYQKFDRCQLTTPRLRYLEYRGWDSIPLEFRSHVIDTIVVGNCGTKSPHEKRVFDNLLSLFCTLGINVNSFTISWSSVEILSSFQEEFVKRSSPFRNLKCLNLDFSYGFDGSSEFIQIASDVKAYLLQNSPDAKVTTNPPYIRATLDSTH